MEQEFVTLPREVVEQVLEALIYCEAPDSSSEEQRFQAAIALRSALEQPQDHVPDAGNMVPVGWKLVPVEPNCSMVLAGERSLGQHDFLRLDSAYRAMLDAAPQPPTTEQSSAVEQPQGEQKPVAWIREEWSSRTLNFDGPPTVPSVRDELTKPVWTPLYTNPQPKRDPLTDECIYEISEDLKWYDGDCDRYDIYGIARAIEAAHNIK